MKKGTASFSVNSNPATIMTDPGLVDATYIEPITWEVVERIIAKERPDVILPTMGGQTALNCALDLKNHGVLDRVRRSNHDRCHRRKRSKKLRTVKLFKEAMKKIGLECAKFRHRATHMQEALEVAADRGIPHASSARASRSAARGGGIAYNMRRVRAESAQRGLQAFPDATSF